jgi:hypothetical protein
MLPSVRFSSFGDFFNFGEKKEEFGDDFEDFGEFFLDVFPLLVDVSIYTYIYLCM